jgi:replicative DNA helicase
MLVTNRGVDDADGRDKSRRYKDSNKVIFQAIQSLYTAGDPIDLLTVSSELKSKRHVRTIGR